MENLVLVKGVMPQLGESSFVAPNAIIAGDVLCKDHCSFWFGSVTRGDVGSIRIGRYTNIQDGAVIHATYKKSSTLIGDYVSIGHNAIVHGATIADHVLIGMSAVILDHAVIEDYCIVAAGAVVLERFTCEGGFLYAGIPARKIKPITSDQRTSLDQTPVNYVLYASWFTNEEG